MILVVSIENAVRSRFSTEKVGSGEKIKKSEKKSEKSDFFEKNFELQIEIECVLRIIK